MKKVITLVAMSLMLAACGRSPVQPAQVVNAPPPVVTYVVSGTVSEATADGSRGLAGATVVVGNDVQGLGTSTDENGTFSLEGIKAGTWQLSVSKEGYETRTMMIDVQSSHKIDVELNTAAN
jgi:uncharacterized lipoprotein YajG